MYFHSNWLYHLLLMTSYFVTIDHHWTWLKMCAMDKLTATENISFHSTHNLIRQRIPHGGWLHIIKTSSKATKDWNSVLICHFSWNYCLLSHFQRGSVLAKAFLTLVWISLHFFYSFICLIRKYACSPIRVRLLLVVQLCCWKYFFKVNQTVFKMMFLTEMEKNGTDCGKPLLRNSCAQKLWRKIL